MGDGDIDTMDIEDGPARDQVVEQANLVRGQLLNDQAQGPLISLHFCIKQFGRVRNCGFGVDDGQNQTSGLLGEVLDKPLVQVSSRLTPSLVRLCSAASGTTNHHSGGR